MPRSRLDTIVISLLFINLAVDSNYFTTRPAATFPVVLYHGRCTTLLGINKQVAWGSLFVTIYVTKQRNNDMETVHQ